jgi:hypothetical protein
VRTATTNVLVSSSLNPSLIGQSTTLTAVVKPVYGGIPTGTVTFKISCSPVGTVTLVGNSATFTTRFNAAGSYTIYASYSGDANFLSGGAYVIQTVRKFSTTTFLASNLNPSTYGQTVTLTATVTSTYGTPTGTITFKNGTTALATVGLTGNTASFSAAALTAGTKSIKAYYIGDSTSRRAPRWG